MTVVGASVKVVIVIAFDWVLTRASENLPGDRMPLFVCNNYITLSV
ncbi:hypothetical protein AM1_B0219 (plasmid) [Acaryochloris marina MBIC11017]|uniref:Uncharacterized protein n=1 Tax=Acaryochloris marina (strain MBIC 11017) TaxID=329726 RepID=A8ZLB2_ACAM1|nr:hypothetical protein AM1_B0219 [Acaryochloris marina MBIC11017]